MSKYTPGPWKLVRGNPLGIHVMSKDGRPVAKIQLVRDVGESMAEASPENKANARLIAAAPHLHSVAQLALSLKELAGKRDVGSQVQFQAMLGNLFALSEIAIAMAEGRDK